jgi:hypothetical protein
MTVNLAPFDILIVFQNGHISGALAELDPSADQGSVDRQDHGRESCVSRHARAGPHARRAGALARARAHALPEGKCETSCAEPVSALYEQRRVFHLGAFPELEDEMCAFTSAGFGGGSPNRVDALVWGITELAVAPMRSFGIFELYRQMAEEQTTRESALIAAPDPMQQRHEAILAERSRYAALMVDRMPTAEEAEARQPEQDSSALARRGEAN